MGEIADEIQQYLAEEKARKRAERADPEIDALEDEEARLLAALRDVQRRLDKLRISRSEYQVGDEVEVRLYGRDVHTWKAAIISRVEPRSWSNTPDYRVNLRNKDGSYSKAERRNIREVRRIP